MSTFNKVLVAVDLEETSAAYVLESAKQLTPGVPIEVVHVLERSYFYGLGDTSYALADDLNRRMLQETGRYLERLCSQAGASDFRVLEGHPAGTIQQYADDNGHDLIVVGTHGRHGIKRLLGSTANALLHGTERNVLAVRVPGDDVQVRPAADKYRRILAAVDLSDESHQVLEVAQILGAQERAQLTVVHVIKPFRHAYAGISPATLSDVGLRFEQEAGEQARAQLESLAARHALPPEAMVLRHGAPAAEIHHLAKEQNSDMLVVGTHGKEGMELLLGSVANAVIHGVTCDVLAVRIH